MNNMISLVSGLIFGFGLILAGMVNPAKVLGFLDLAGLWDPSLSLVMGGAIVVASAAFAKAKRRTKSMLGLPMHLTTPRHLDRRLIGGSILFGIGWGLAGICPGTALVLLGTGASKGLVIVAAMLVGMGLFEFLERRRTLHLVQHNADRLPS